MSDDITNSNHADSRTAIEVTSLIIFGLIILGVLSALICTKSCKRRPERNNTVMAEPLEPPTIEISYGYPSFRYKSTSTGSNECSVCFRTIQDCVMVREMPVCKHVFHMSCIDTWLSSNPTCPLCRCNLQVSYNGAAADPQSSSAK